MKSLVQDAINESLSDFSREAGRPSKRFGVCEVSISRSSPFTLLQLFLCEFAHAPKRLARPIDQRAIQSQRIFLCDLQNGEFVVSQASQTKRN